MHFLSKFSVTLAAVSATLLLSACGAAAPSASEAPAGTAWPAENREAFTNECLRTSDGAEAYCECSLEGLEAKYSFAEFTDLEQRLVEDLSVMGELQETLESCAHLF
ncbi:hypothetical protein ACFSWE_14800 [Leucobacter albus]|uniref:Uncharacterized protein n=1 Tax=Leucobacter albus TaxID=272210 RepID=A0ABW3TNL7_9MICO